MLILAGSSVLNIAFSIGKASGPGVAWAKLLKSRGGPLTTILGYSGKVPFDRIEGSQIATLMGKKIAAGLTRINGSRCGSSSMEIPICKMPVMPWEWTKRAIGG